MPIRQDSWLTSLLAAGPSPPHLLAREVYLLRLLCLAARAQVWYIVFSVVIHIFERTILSDGTLRCFFQADDAGLHADVTEGIVSCLGKGPLAGVGVIMGAPHDARAVALLAARGDIALTAHLNLLEGFAVAPPRRIPELVGKDGRFCHSLASLTAGLYWPGRGKKALLRAVETEFRAQIERFSSLTSGLPLRLDSHLHIHALPPLRPMLRRLIQEYRPSYLRVPAELFHLPRVCAAEQAAGQARRALLACWASPLRRLLADEGIATSNFFVGAFASGALTLDKLRVSLQAVSQANANRGGGEALVEIMTHPGGIAPDAKVHADAAIRPGYRGFYTSRARAAERQLLTSPTLGGMLRLMNVTPYFPAALA
ncbi:MAG: ChbG/HpnK family deacetylase [Desulfovibrio sp.]|nr:ChbG/HpnK family deacetylase [Desulfovibrio sp.]